MTNIETQINQRLTQILPALDADTLRNLPALAGIVHDVRRHNFTGDDAGAATAFATMSAIAEGVATGFQLGHDAAGGE